MLILYGAPATQAAAAVLVYHAIAFWVPSLGGIFAYWRLRCRLRDAHAEATRAAHDTSRPPDFIPSFAEACGLRWPARRAAPGRR
jgi:hypothetical protein